MRTTLVRRNSYKLQSKTSQRECLQISILLIQIIQGLPIIDKKSQISSRRRNSKGHLQAQVKTLVSGIKPNKFKNQKWLKPRNSLSVSSLIQRLRSFLRNSNRSKRIRRRRIVMTTQTNNLHPRMTRTVLSWNLRQRSRSRSRMPNQS